MFSDEKLVNADRIKSSVMERKKELLIQHDKCLTPLCVRLWVDFLLKWRNELNTFFLRESFFTRLSLNELFVTCKQMQIPSHVSTKMLLFTLFSLQTIVINSEDATSIQSQCENKIHIISAQMPRFLCYFATKSIRSKYIRYLHCLHAIDKVAVFPSKRIHEN